MCPLFLFERQNGQGLFYRRVHKISILYILLLMSIMYPFCKGFFTVTFKYVNIGVATIFHIRVTAKDTFIMGKDYARTHFHTNLKLGKIYILKPYYLCTF